MPWVGLRGSVPNILAIFPLLFGLPGAALIFHVVFFVVLISATVQESTLPTVARKLGLTERPPATPAATLEITALGDVGTERAAQPNHHDGAAADGVHRVIRRPPPNKPSGTTNTVSGHQVRSGTPRQPV